MSLDLPAVRVMLAGPPTLLRAGCAQLLELRGHTVLLPEVAEFDLAREAGAARAFSALEPDAVVCLGGHGLPGSGAVEVLGRTLSTALALVERSVRAGVRRFVWIGGAQPAADDMMAALASAHRAGGPLDIRLIVPDAGGAELTFEEVAKTAVDVLERGDIGGVVSLPGYCADQPSPNATDAGPGFSLPPVEEIADGDQVIALILRGSLVTPGVSFFSRDHFSQQLGFIHHPAGHVIPPHVHNPVPREVTYTQETLFVREGRLRVDLYRSDRTPLTTRVLATGDVILLCTGGHGFQVLEESSIVEVKQGPYAGDGDKTRFEAAE